MLTKCVNFACSARFLYLHEGKVFRLETAPPPHRANGGGNHQTEYFWLCARCAQILKVVVENGVVTTRPLRFLLTEGKPGVKELSACS
ncbi:MAG: hypothetical protein LAO03_10600 [Acidobacteriia bacterium]|nr:hypothetical protein [Terriglobia bacterium]